MLDQSQMPSQSLLVASPAPAPDDMMANESFLNEQEDDISPEAIRASQNPVARPLPCPSRVALRRSNVFTWWLLTPPALPQAGHRALACETPLTHARARARAGHHLEAAFCEFQNDRQLNDNFERVERFQLACGEVVDRMEQNDATVSVQRLVRLVPSASCGWLLAAGACLVNPPRAL